MNKIFLTSNLDFYYKDKNGNRVAKALDNANGIVDNIKKYIKKYDNVLYIASVEDNPTATDIYGNVTCQGAILTFGFNNYNILDGRNANNAKELIGQADMIILSGGHLPSQNKFFNNINLAELLYDSEAVICGISAGSMNSARSVYCPPELDGETDDGFKRYLNGLGLTELNIIPHFSDRVDFRVDGKRYVEDILMVDSFKTPLLILNDGSYVMKYCDDMFQVRGLAFTLKQGVITKICDNEKYTYINEKTLEVYDASISFII